MFHAWSWIVALVVTICRPPSFPRSEFFVCWHQWHPFPPLVSLLFQLCISSGPVVCVHWKLFFFWSYLVGVTSAFLSWSPVACVIPRYLWLSCISAFLPLYNSYSSRSTQLFLQPFSHNYRVRMTSWRPCFKFWWGGSLSWHLTHSWHTTCGSLKTWRPESSRFRS